jgi:phospholipid transport system substrate-binding protein
MREKVRRAILVVVDMRTVSMLTLSNYRRKFSEKQFEQFMERFSHLLFVTYITHLEKHSNEKVEVVGTEDLSETRMRVKTKTITTNKEIPIDFSFLKQEDRWLLYDVHVEGVSLVKNYRSQFREILLNRSVGEFLERLKEKVEENEKDL